MAKAQYTIRIEEDLLDKLKTVSEIELRSLNAQIEYFLRESIEQYAKDEEVNYLLD